MGNRDWRLRQREGEGGMGKRDRDSEWEGEVAGEGWEGEEREGRADEEAVVAGELSGICCQLQ